MRPTTTIAFCAVHEDARSINWPFVVRRKDGHQIDSFRDRRDAEAYAAAKNEQVRSGEAMLRDDARRAATRRKAVDARHGVAIFRKHTPTRREMERAVESGERLMLGFHCDGCETRIPGVVWAQDAAEQWCQLRGAGLCSVLVEDIFGLHVHEWGGTRLAERQALAEANLR